MSESPNEWIERESKRLGRPSFDWAKAFDAACYFRDNLAVPTMLLVVMVFGLYWGPPMMPVMPALVVAGNQTDGIVAFDNANEIVWGEK